MTDDIQNKMRNEHARKERDARFAGLMVEHAQTWASMVDEHSPAVLEAMIDYLKDLQKPDSGAPKRRQKLRAALIEYGEHALGEARRREDKLYYALTGETEKVHATDK
jgi:hypothetical protein